MTVDRRAAVIRQRLLGPVALGSALALLFVVFSLTPFARRLEHQFGLGVLFGLRGPIEPPPGAIVVAIDNATIAWLRESAAGPAAAAPALAGCLPARILATLAQVRGPAGLPRALNACLLAELRRLGAPVVAFDILFSVKGDPEEDALLAEALRSHGSTVLLVGFGRSTVEAGGAELVIDRQIEPYALFVRSAAATGAFLVPRINGPVHGYWRRIATSGAVRSLPEEVFLLRRPATLAARQDGDLVYLWHYGPAGSIPTLSMRDVLTGDIAEPLKAALRSSSVFIGASDPRSTDYVDTFPSFFANRATAAVSGVELAATAYLNLSAGHHLRRLPQAAEAGLIAAFVLCFGVLALARVRAAPFIVVAGAIAYAAVAAWAFIQPLLILPLTLPVFLAAPLCFFLAVLMRYRFARALAMRLAPAPVARRMLARARDGRGLVIEEDATIVFCDLIGSSGIAERMPELEFNALLNTYFDTMAREIEKRRGFISAFAGDGLLAVFTGSDAGADHAVQACRAMVAAVQAIRSVNLANAALGRPALAQRIGINSGRVAEGEIGARERYNFSVVGDVVNLAARLEQLGKTLFPGQADIILIGAATARLIDRPGFTLEDCGIQAIAGRRSAEQVFRIVQD